MQFLTLSYTHYNCYLDGLPLRAWQREGNGALIAHRVALLLLLQQAGLPLGLGEGGLGDLSDTEDRDGLRVGVMGELLTVP